MVSDGQGEMPPLLCCVVAVARGGRREGGAKGRDNENVCVCPVGGFCVARGDYLPCCTASFLTGGNFRVGRGV